MEEELKRWEYTTCSSDLDVLKERGLEGWELAANNYNATSHRFYVLKRPINDSDDGTTKYSFEDIERIRKAVMQRKLYDSNGTWTGAGPMVNEDEIRTLMAAGVSVEDAEATALEANHRWYRRQPERATSPGFP